MTPEQIASQRVRLAASSLGCRLFRNNSGGFYDEQGRFVRFGLGNESAQLNQQLKFGDYVGITPIVITPEMVGKTVGIFTNLEVKPEGMLNATINKASKGLLDDPDMVRRCIIANGNSMGQQRVQPHTDLEFLTLYTIHRYKDGIALL